MGNAKADGAVDRSGEGSLRGAVATDAAPPKKRNVDRAVRVDDEKDTLYDDGLDVREDDSPPLGTSSSP